MRMRTGIFACAAALAALTLATPGWAGQKIAYIPDPVYQSFDPEVGSPMQEMIALAEGGDVRAQFILGDLYAKGKGGLKKNERRGAKWFERAAKNGYYPGLVRLAAIAKRKKKPVDAYKWYTLAQRLLPRRDPWYIHADKAREALVKDFDMKDAQIDEAKREAGLWQAEVRRWREEKKAEERAAKKAEAEKEPEKKTEKTGAKKKADEKKDAKKDKKKKSAAPAGDDKKTEEPTPEIKQEYNR